VQGFRPIETLVPQKAAGYGEPIRRVAAMARAGMPVPAGFALSRERLDAMLVSAGLPQIVSLIDLSGQRSAEAELAELKARWLELGVDAGMRDALRAVMGRLEGGGARALTLSVVLVCDKTDADRVLGGTQLGIDNHAVLTERVRHGVAALFDRPLLTELRARGVRTAGISLLIQRMVDGLVSGVVFTRHPVTGDAREWLVRAGYGLASKVRRGEVGCDVIRVTRDGFVRDFAIGDKAAQFVAQRDGTRLCCAVPEGLRDRAALNEAMLPELLQLSTRVERHFGAPVSVEWALQDSRLHLLGAELLPTERKITRERPSLGRERALWSHQELGEALPDALSPLTWSLLRRFTRVGLTDALRAGGAAFAQDTDLILDVRGRAYLNLSAITDSVCRLPFVTPETLRKWGIEIGALRDPDTLGVLDLGRAALRVIDTQVRFVRRLPFALSAVKRERSHFAGLDPRLLSPDAVERVLCDVETWMRDAGLALMRCYGLWVTALVGLRAILVEYYGDDALRLERDLLWGPDEVLPAQSGARVLNLARSLAGDSRVRAWADGAGEIPAFLEEALLDLTRKSGHEGLSWMDPECPRFHEELGPVFGALRVLWSDPMALSLASERVSRTNGRRERAEREWKRRVPMLLWPVTQVLITRLRALTKQRESLLIDASQSVALLREIALDASRRLSMREPSLGREGAFGLQLDELHAMLAKGQWDVRERIEQRRIELRLVADLPAAPMRFVGRPNTLETHGQDLVGAGGSGGAAEGKVVRILDGSELGTLPPGAVLVVKACDVGLSPILPAVRAVIAESGGMLSHGAMLASALGVPAVVGVAGAFAQLRDGERVRVDADRNCVERLPELAP